MVTLGHGGDDTRAVGVDNRGGAAALGAELAGFGYRDTFVMAASEGIRTSDDRLGVR